MAVLMAVLVLVLVRRARRWQKGSAPNDLDLFVKRLVVGFEASEAPFHIQSSQKAPTIAVTLAIILLAGFGKVGGVGRALC